MPIGREYINIDLGFEDLVNQAMLLSNVNILRLASAGSRLQR